jgi:hypothetical protein
MLRRKYTKIDVEILNRSSFLAKKLVSVFLLMARRFLRRCSFGSTSSWVSSTSQCVQKQKGSTCWQGKQAQQYDERDTNQKRKKGIDGASIASEINV